MAGTSDYHHIPYVLDVIAQAAPTCLLDIGVGFGRWGALCREVLEASAERVARHPWACQIDGIEIFESYRNPLWGAVYDRVYLGNALEILDTLGRYDLILCGDVIEHLDKSQGRKFLDQMLNHADLVVLTSPSIPYPQGALAGNEHERHLSQWSKADFAHWPHRYQDLGTTFLAVVAKTQERLAPITPRHPLASLGVRRGSRELLGLLLQRLQSR